MGVRKGMSLLESLPALIIFAIAVIMILGTFESAALGISKSANLWTATQMGQAIFEFETEGHLFTGFFPYIANPPWTVLNGAFSSLPLYNVLSKAQMKQGVNTYPGAASIHERTTFNYAFAHRNVVPGGVEEADLTITWMEKGALGPTTRSILISELGTQ